MPVEYKKKVAVFTDSVAIEEAEELLNWLTEESGRSINMKQCTHIHTAVFQTILFKKPRISVEPPDQDLKNWLTAAALLTEE